MVFSKKPKKQTPPNSLVSLLIDSKLHDSFGTWRTLKRVIWGTKIIVPVLATVARDPFAILTLMCPEPGV